MDACRCIPPPLPSPPIVITSTATTTLLQYVWYRYHFQYCSARSLSLLRSSYAAELVCATINDNTAKCSARLPRDVLSGWKSPSIRFVFVTSLSTDGFAAANYRRARSARPSHLGAVVRAPRYRTIVARDYYATFLRLIRATIVFS